MFIDYSRTIAWTGQILMAMAKFWVFKLVEEIIMALPVVRLISKCWESTRTHLPQPIQRSGKTLSFWRGWGVGVIWSTFCWIEGIGVKFEDVVTNSSESDL